MTEPGDSELDPTKAIERALDTKTVEVLAAAVLRAMFPAGVRMPLKLDGLLDLDVTLRDNNVFVNANELHAQLPELSVWRFTFAYQGKPIVELGRGVKNNMRIHYVNFFFLLVTIWKNKRHRTKSEARAAVEKYRALSRESMGPPTPGLPGDGLV